jgi:hypothetical protein
MPDPHKFRPSLRLPPELKAAAQEKLRDQPERDEPWTLNDVVVAAVAMFVKRPKVSLKQLEPFKPPRKVGRPPKSPQT